MAVVIAFITYSAIIFTDISNLDHFNLDSATRTIEPLLYIQVNETTQEYLEVFKDYKCKGKCVSFTVSNMLDYLET